MTSHETADPLLVTRALLLADLAASGAVEAELVNLVEDVVAQRRWWVGEWPQGAPYVAGQAAQDLQDRLLDESGRRWPPCPTHEGTHELALEPELGPDPHWVCHESAAVIAPLGRLARPVD